MTFHVDKFEKRRLFIISALLIVTWLVQILYAARDNPHPPSNVKWRDSAQLQIGTGVRRGWFAKVEFSVIRDAIYVPRTKLNLTIVSGDMSDVGTGWVLPGKQSFLCDEFCGPALERADVYCASVTTDGVLMAYVLTTFFIMGFGYHLAINSPKSPGAESSVRVSGIQDVSFW